MNLFNIVPSNYFSIFSGKNREIYIEALEILYSLLQNEESVIKKNDFLSAIKSKESNLDSLDLEEELSKEELEEGISFTDSSKASFIIRRLEETGWVDISMDIDNYEEVVVLPPYTISLLKTFNDIVSDEESPYVSLVHSTYSELKLEDEELDDLIYATLLRCYENTKKLKVELVTLTHSIRIFQNRLTKLFDTNEVLHSYFDIYKKKISDRYYHPLKTFDSVAKFKRPIIKILDRWLNNKEIRNKLVLLASLSAKNNNKQEIENDIITKINYITDTYSNLNVLINSIDKENSQYTKASTQKILYLNNSDRTIKGHLENIFKYFAASKDDNRFHNKILDMMNDSFDFYEQGYIDSDSLILPILKKFKEKGEPMEIPYFDDTSDVMMDEFIEHTSNMFSDDKVYSFIESSLSGKKEISTKDMVLDSEESIICLILAICKYDDDTSFYTIELNENKEIINGGYLIPDFTFVKKDEQVKEENE